MVSQMTNMKKSLELKKVLTKQLDGCWDWYVLVWTSASMFSDLEIKNPHILGHGKFVNESAARADMKKKLKLLGIKCS